VDWQTAKKPNSILVSVDLHVTRTEMAEHLFDVPLWEFGPEGESLKIVGFDDAFCYQWVGQWSSVKSCVAHPDKAGRPPTFEPDMDRVSGAGLPLPVSQSRSCGPYRDQFDHPGEYEWWECAARQGDWATLCFQFYDGCEGYRGYNVRYQSWDAWFYWTLCYH
jgi:hypothetical protein